MGRLQHPLGLPQIASSLAYMVCEFVIHLSVFSERLTDRKRGAPRKLGAGPSVPERALGMERGLIGTEEREGPTVLCARWV